MNLECDNCDQCFEVNPNDLDRIKKASSNSLSMMLIICSKCKNQTTWYNGIETCQPDANINFIEDLRKNKIPNSYIKHLKDRTKLEVNIFDDESDFSLYSNDDLLKKVNIDNILYYQVSQILGFIKTIKEFALEDIKEDLELLENSISIGYENTRILFIDGREANSSLYIFHPDGGDIEKTSLRINNLIE